MSLKKNIIANYASQLYAAGIGILILPLYIKYMGAEAYGLVGFFTMLQAWFAMLDLGLTPTVARETARYNGGLMAGLHYRQLFRSLSVIFFSVAITGGGALWFLAEPMAHKWLNAEELSIETVLTAMEIMAVSVALRWLGGLYRGVITGFEKIIWLSAFNAAIATLRFPAVFISFWIYGISPEVFFWHQLVIALCEVLGLYAISNRLKPSVKRSEKIGWSFSPVKKILKFAMTIAFTSSIWVCVTQIDKLILSGILPLSEYGYFTLAVLVASGVLLLSAPVSTVIMPRMTRLHAQKDDCEMIQLYRNSTQLVSIVSGTAALMIVFYAESLLYAWTGDHDVSTNAAPILRLYAIGNGVLSIVAFPYYFQYAVGKLRYHLIGNVIIVFTLIPAIIYSANYYGAVGAGWAWFFVNLLYLLLWVAYVHHKLKPGLHLRWLIVDVLFIFMSVTIFLSILTLWPLNLEGRFQTLMALGLIGSASLFVALMASSTFRSYLHGRLFGCGAVGT